MYKMQMLIQRNLKMLGIGRVRLVLLWDTSEDVLRDYRENGSQQG